MSINVDFDYFHTDDWDFGIPVLDFDLDLRPLAMRQRRPGLLFFLNQDEHQLAFFSSASGGRRLHRRCLNLAVRYEAAIGG